FYFLFFNVDYPDNLKAFLEICNIGTFNFAPNLFSSYDTTMPAPKHFFENDHSGNFYQTAGSILTIWGVVLPLTLAFTLLSKLFSGRFMTKLSTIKKILYAQVSLLWEASCIDLIYASLLQLKAKSFVHGSMASALVLSVLSLIIAAGYGVYNYF